MPAQQNAQQVKVLEQIQPKLESALKRAQDLLLDYQFPEGYWWFTLEANESIGSGYIMLTEFLGCPKPSRNQAIARRILQTQREDGSWGLYTHAPGELGISIECYFALKLCGYSPDHPALLKARQFILKAGGPTKARVFTKIQLAMFGLAPWNAAPAMPLELILAPSWAPVNIYEFSSWARACIVPLLIIMYKKKIRKTEVDLEELYPEPAQKRHWKFSTKGPFYSSDNFFIYCDKVIKGLGKIPKPQPLKPLCLKKCEQYLREHIEKTEDIFPALAYGAIAFKALGYGLDDPTLSKAVQVLESFQQAMEVSGVTSINKNENLELPPIPRDCKEQELPEVIHQQCCISPVWDTPWTALSLIESGISAQHPAFAKAAQWLIEKQVKDVKGDWAIKNPNVEPGGWSFEFKNDYFPDTDDTIEVLMFLFKTGLNSNEKQESFDRGLQWLLSMQSKNGGWAAFDVDNTLDWVNRIPFSDHGACLDPPTADLTSRVLELLGMIGHDPQDSRVQRAIEFLLKEQDPLGPWEGRWGVNYLYGTWSVLQGLSAIGQNHNHPALLKATEWLLETQNSDGGWGESCESYVQKRFVPLPYSVPSQTAWALLGLMAVGLADTTAVAQGVEFLLEQQNALGSWDEEEYTGTGFPGHFYIRYHGYRHYFPLLALGKYKKLKG